MPKISLRADVDPNAMIAEDVEIGPFCVVGPDVKIGVGCRLLNSVTIAGRTTIGNKNTFHPNAVIGSVPQDKKYKGEPTELIIGSGNVFREAVTVHLGTDNGGGVTRIGDNGLYMVNMHIGHDCTIGNGVIIANNVMMSGHTICEDDVAIMAGAAIFHFVTLGTLCYVGSYAKIHRNVPPYCKMDGVDEIRGLNKTGLVRAGFAESDIAALDAAYQKLFNRQQPLKTAIMELESQQNLNPHVKRLIDFFGRR